MDTNSPDANLASEPQLRFGKIDGLFARVEAAMSAARNLLFSAQHQDGYWCGELEADTTLESDYILLHALLGTGNPERFQKAANYILQHQNEDGGWRIYAARPPALQRPPKKNLEMGGGPEVNSFYQDLSVFLRSVRLRRCARHPA